MVRPRSFAALMTLYADNHSRLRQLLGELLRLPPVLVSVSATDLSLFLTLEERCRYTTSLRMTYRFDADGCSSVYPDLLLRIYHDARLVEAASCSQPPPRHAALKGVLLPAAYELERRWTLNIFLNKWLAYCLDNHHVFA